MQQRGLFAIAELLVFNCIYDAVDTAYVEYKTNIDISVQENSSSSTDAISQIHF